MFGFIRVKRIAKYLILMASLVVAGCALTADRESANSDTSGDIEARSVPAADHLSSNSSRNIQPTFPKPAFEEEYCGASAFYAVYRTLDGIEYHRPEDFIHKASCKAARSPSICQQILDETGNGDDSGALADWAARCEALVHQMLK